MIITFPPIRHEGKVLEVWLALEPVLDETNSTVTGTHWEKHFISENPYEVKHRKLNDNGAELPYELSGKICQVKIGGGIPLVGYNVELSISSDRPPVTINATSDLEGKIKGIIHQVPPFLEGSSYQAKIISPQGVTLISVEGKYQAPFNFGFRTAPPSA